MAIVDANSTGMKSLNCPLPSAQDNEGVGREKRKQINATYPYRIQMTHHNI